MNKSIIFTIFLVFFLVIGAVSAQEDNSQDCIISTQEDNLQGVEETKSFSVLQTQIDDCSDNGVLNLNSNYAYESGDSVITVNHNNFTIDGHNNKIDASKQTQIFKVGGENVTIKNLIFTNGYTELNSSGAIASGGAGLLIINSTFIDNYGIRAGAIHNYKSIDNVSVVNCTFINNSAKYSGGAINNDMGDYFSVDRCTFINNTVKESRNGGSAIYNWGGTHSLGGNYFSVVNSRFINNTAVLGAIYNSEASNFSVINCSFLNNSGYN